MRATPKISEKVAHLCNDLGQIIYIVYVAQLALILNTVNTTHSLQHSIEGLH